MVTMLRKIQDELQTYGETHEQMHSAFLEFKFEITKNIYLVIGIGQLTEYYCSMPNQMVHIEKYDLLPMHVAYHTGERFSPWRNIKLKDIYWATFQNGSSPFEFIFDENLKPYQLIEKISQLIKDKTYQDVIEQIAKK